MTSSIRKSLSRIVLGKAIRFVYGCRNSYRCLFTTRLDFRFQGSIPASSTKPEFLCFYFGPIITPLADGTGLAERFFRRAGPSAMPDEEV